MAEQHNGSEVAGGPKDELLRKMGRNLLLFQKAEKRLKWLGVRTHISAMADELEAVMEKARDAVAKDTMGGARRRATENATVTEKEQEKIEKTLKEKGGVHLAVSFSFHGKDAEPDAEWEERLKVLVRARNNFVHHFHGRFNLATREGSEAAARYLNEQHAEFSPVVADLKRRCEGVIQTAEAAVAALRLEDILRRAAAARAREDGWTDLTVAGQELKAEEPDLLRKFTKAFGHSGLKDAVAAMDQFEVRDEPTGSGVRVLYRPQSPNPSCDTIS